MTYESLLEDVYEAYFDCLKNKHGKISAIEFSMNYGNEIRKLTEELWSGSYEISKSIVFGVTRPKNREVFAANFRDRVVHHLIMQKLCPILESYMIEDSFNCRVGKGTSKGISRLQEQINLVSRGYTSPAYTLCLDIQGFFMSINKDKCRQMTVYAIMESWCHGDLSWWVNLVEKVIMHRPEQHCIIKGDKSILDRLPDNKTLFRSNGKGLPIGNLTSQIFGNFYLTPFDKWLMSQIEGKALYCRYVDDLRITSTDKQFLLHLIPVIKSWLWQNLELCLHPNKISIQEVKKGVRFIGYIITPHGLHISNRVVDHAFTVSKSIPRNKNETEAWCQRMNSYMGFLRQCKSYSIRRNVYDNVPDETKANVICINFKKYKINKSKYNVYNSNILSRGVQDCRKA